MEQSFHPTREAFEDAKRRYDPMPVPVAFDGSEMLAGPAEYIMEHLTQLRKLDRSDSSIDRYFRLVVNAGGADRTFAFPSDFGGIPDRTRRIEAFCNAGIEASGPAFGSVVCSVPVRIPRRYRLHRKKLSG